MASAKRPLEDPSSPSAPTDLPEAKRPALDKLVKDEPTSDGTEPGFNATLDGPKVVQEHALPPMPITNGTAEAQTDAPAPVGTNGTLPAPPSDTHPIPSTASQSERIVPDTQVLPTQDETNWIHIRAVISSAEAATCIGKGGENVTQIRKLSGAKCTVSDYSRGAVERILTVSGAQDAVAKVESLKSIVSSSC
jgi:heterogeneous nuclear rnp K-like protein 2